MDFKGLQIEMTTAGKQELAKTLKGNYESFLIALFIWSKTKDMTNKTEKELVDLHRNLTHVVRNRLYDPMMRFEKTAVEIVNKTGGITELPEVDDPIWISAFTHSQAVVGNALEVNNANSGDGLEPVGNIIWEKQMGDLKYQRS